MRQAISRTRRAAIGALLAGTSVLIIAAPAAADIRNIAKNAVASKQIDDGSVLGKDIAGGAIGTDQVDNRGLRGGDLALGTIQFENFSVSVQTQLEEVFALTGQTIDKATIDTGDIVDSAVTRAKIRSDAITGFKVENQSLTGDDILDGSISGADIATPLVLPDGSVTTQKLADLAVTTAKIGNGQVTGDKLSFDPATQTELNALISGLSSSDGNPPNVGSNRVHWNVLNGVPAGFADGVDDVGGGPHDHDDRYFTENELQSPGVINTPSNPVDWTKLKGVPGGFADGTDDAGGPPTGPAGGDLLGSFYPAPEIAPGAVTDVELADGTALTELLDDDGPGSQLDADFLDGLSSAAFQARVDGNCGAGEAIRQVNANGTVICEPTGGGGGGGGVPDDNSVTSEKILDGEVGPQDLDVMPAAEGDGLLNGSGALATANWPSATVQGGFTFDSSSDAFTVPRTGRYLINMSVDDAVMLNAPPSCVAPSFTGLDIRMVARRGAVTPGSEIDGVVLNGRLDPDPFGATTSTSLSSSDVVRLPADEKVDFQFQYTNGPACLLGVSAEVRLSYLSSVPPIT